MNRWVAQGVQEMTTSVGFGYKISPFSTMAHTPPSTLPPPTSLSIREADTITKNRSIHAVDHRSTSIKDICEEEGIAHATGKKWLKHRNHLGAAALPRTNKTQNGRLKKMSSKMLNQMLNSHTNPVRDQPRLCQIEHFDLNVAPRTLQAPFNNRSPRVSCFTIAKVRTASN